ncbi:toxin-antitoxin system HicB family antitoxin [Kitasatospora aureofaciens]|uniref:toxin-antitoxin system HicB family antitoxin n=1 Tax=Kitasatospora aureofaciens TaxID=1894 RepID=UPI000527B235|nr:toxin-antitoxin system HicB family antitoxin [Kitasatospora aureofaciens]HJD81730.1 toxin-antitoxin system HicB family antitoxin [Kitasatospora aureofaciens]
MDLTPYVENLRNELAVAAATGGDEARALAERLTLPLESAVRLTLLNALSAAMGEVTRDLAPGSVDVRLRGLDPEFVVTAPPGADAFHGEGSPVEPPVAPSVAPPVAPSASPVVPEADEAGTARINLRLPANLKARAEEAAGQEGLSLNAWLVRAVAGAVEGGRPVARPAAALGSRTTRSVGGQGFTGWVH